MWHTQNRQQSAAILPGRRVHNNKYFTVHHRTTVSYRHTGVNKQGDHSCVCVLILTKLSTALSVQEQADTTKFSPSIAKTKTITQLLPFQLFSPGQYPVLQLLRVFHVGDHHPAIFHCSKNKNLLINMKRICHNYWHRVWKKLTLQADMITKCISDALLAVIRLNQQHSTQLSTKCIQDNHSIRIISSAALQLTMALVRVEFRALHCRDNW